MVYRKVTFVPRDFVALIPLTISALCCFIFAFYAPNATALTIVLITGLVFALSIPGLYVLRMYARSFDFITSFGAYVKLGKRHKPNRLDIERWIEETRSHWLDLRFRDFDGYMKQGFLYDNKIFNAEAYKVNAKLKETNIYFADGRLSLGKRFVHGWSDGKDICIERKDKPAEVKDQPNIDWDNVNTYQVFLHELSHNFLLTIKGIPWSEKIHHEIFAKTRLGAAS